MSTSFQVHHVRSEGELSDQISKSQSTAGVYCVRESSIEELNKLTQINHNVAPTPLFICSKTACPRFIHNAIENGFSRFVFCDMVPELIEDAINEAIFSTSIRKIVDSVLPGNWNKSRYSKRIITEILRDYPQKTSMETVAKRLNISRRWLQVICNESFKLSFTQLFRKIRVHHALYLMRNCQLDNADIALRLGYNEYSNMTRDFHLELGTNPKNVRALEQE